MENLELAKALKAVKETGAARHQAEMSLQPGRPETADSYAAACAAFDAASAELNRLVGPRDNEGMYRQGVMV